MSKKIQLLFLIIFLPFIAFAEYNGHQIKFSIDFKDGSKIIGYNYLATVYQKDKSISYKEFLEKNYKTILSNQFNDLTDEYTYFQNRIKYNYNDYDGNERFIYTLTDKKGIDINSIKSLNIIELTDQSYAIGISSKHNWKDRLWMNDKPVETFYFGANLCSHTVYIHQKTNQTDSIIKQLEKISIEFENKIKEQKNIIENSNGSTVYEASDEIDKLEEEIGTEISKLLQKFDEMKVVILTMCSC
ncbi:hypothetical protein HSX10_17455 [Winogradskyella undariae]|uniref:hypothetical protein n=1 Tax=Winogradskyella undariae TaxID=1285465 RepID=UPI00156BA37A|nr:hypothetical protein [Winogradskyella undariae]NRR93364.1 hypothetical protein [Winogradskyella undariae]